MNQNETSLHITLLRCDETYSYSQSSIQMKTRPYDEVPPLSSATMLCNVLLISRSLKTCYVVGKFEDVRSEWLYDYVVSPHSKE